jgi:transposase-like protein
MSDQKKQSTEAAVREIRRRSRLKFSPEEKIRIVLEGLRGEQSVSDLCRREGIASNLYDRWSKDFLEAGKKHLAGDTVREATVPKRILYSMYPSSRSRSSSSGSSGEASPSSPGAST